MKLIVAVALLLCLSAPCWAQDHSPSKESEVKRLWPGGGYIDDQLPKNLRRGYEREAIVSVEPDGGVSIYYKWVRWEHKVIPEAELETWLNQGWECDRVYTIMLDGRGIVDKYGPYPPGGKPVNKAIIRRAKP